MLKLNYIIADLLPEYELQHLKENLNIVNEELPAKNWQFILLQESRKNLSEYPAEESLFISANKKHLRKATKLGIATLGYLLQDGELLCQQMIFKEIAESVDLPNEVWNKDGELPHMDESLQPECDNSEDAEATESIPSVDMYAEGLEEVDFTFLNHIYERHHNIPWTILETERCSVREFSMDYLDELFEMYAGDGMTDYMEPLFDYEQEKEYQQAYIEHMYRFYGYGMWIVCDKQTGHLIGRAGIEHREELDGELELGYAIAVPYQNQVMPRKSARLSFIM